LQSPIAIVPQFPAHALLDVTVRSRREQGFKKRRATSSHRRHRLERNSYMSRQARATPMSVDRSRHRPNVTEVVMSVSLIALIIVILLLIGALPSWGYSSGWGYWPSGGLGLVLLILIILMVMGRI
jgi:hypothetical protein